MTMENIRKFDKFNEELNNNIEKIPTAEEFMNSKEFEPDRGITYEDYWGESAGIVPSMLVKFAKLHVQACKESIKENIRVDIDEYGNVKGFDDIMYNSILNSYPLGNIKY